MTPDELRQILVDCLTPDYETKFKIKRNDNVMNILGLTRGPRAYILMKDQQNKRVKYLSPNGPNSYLIRGSAIHNYIEETMKEWLPQTNGLKWILPYNWQKLP